MKAELIEAARKAGLKPKANGHAKEKRADADLVLFREPTEEILLLGVMLVDAKTQTDLLKGLASAGEGYRGHLRIIRGAAKRMADRCSLLLGEKK